MRTIEKLFKFPFYLLTFFLTLQCGSSALFEGLEVPVELPEVCRDIDFNLNIEMREVCGVKLRSYRSYKNVAQYRYLLQPKSAKIVKKGSKLELRMEKTLPVKLPDNFKNKIQFGETVRNQFIKSILDYQEFIPEGEHERIKMIKIVIPFNDGDRGSVCYLIPPPNVTASHLRRGFANSLEPLTCEKFDKLKEKITGN